MKKLSTYITFSLTKKYLVLILVFLSTVASLSARSAGQDIQLTSIELQVSEDSTASETEAVQESDVKEDTYLSSSWMMIKFILLAVVIVFGATLERIKVLRRREQLASISSQLFIAF